jgi:hypothetical protein
MSDRWVQYRARSDLRRAGYGATCLDIPQRPILLVEHGEEDLRGVWCAVSRLDPRAAVVLPTRSVSDGER